MKKIFKILVVLILLMSMTLPALALDARYDANSVISQMTENSKAWLKANADGDADEMQRLHDENVLLSEKLSEFGIVSEYDSETGKWYISEGIDKKELYSSYDKETNDEQKEDKNTSDVVVNGKTLVQLPPSETDNKTQEIKNDSGEFLTVVTAMTKGFWTTLKLFAITLAGALPLGLVIALCSMSKFLPLKWFTRVLVWIIRGTPLMLQLLIIFYIPGMVMEGGTPWPRGEEGRFMAASVAFIINYAFYFSEIYRGGIESIPHGQVEAGQVLGMTKTQIFFNVTLLQMIKRIVPPMSNEIITLVKDTSIARIISLQEVIWAGYSFLKGSHGYSGLLWPLFFTGVYYLLFNGLLTILFGRIEKKLSYFKA